MIDVDIFDEFDNAIQKVDREIINLKLKKKKINKKIRKTTRCVQLQRKARGSVVNQKNLTVILKIKGVS